MEKKNDIDRKGAVVLFVTVLVLALVVSVIMIWGAPEASNGDRMILAPDKDYSTTVTTPTA